MDIQIRVATSSDLPAMRDLLVESNTMHQLFLSGVLKKLPPDWIFQWCENNLNNSNHTIFVLECGEKVAGMVMLQMVEQAEDPYFHAQRHAYINELVVAEKHRGQGLGKRLMEFVKTWAKEQGAPEIHLNVFDGNQNSVAFYEAMGYQTLKRTMTLDLI